MTQNIPHVSGRFRFENINYENDLTRFSIKQCEWARFSLQSEEQNPFYLQQAFLEAIAVIIGVFPSNVPISGTVEFDPVVYSDPHRQIFIEASFNPVKFQVTRYDRVIELKLSAP